MPSPGGNGSHYFRFWIGLKSSAGTIVMGDIWVAVLVMSVVSAIAALTAAGYLHTDRGQRVMLVFALSILATFFFLLYFNGQLFWARIVPSSAAIIYTNLAAVFAGLGAGWGWRLPKTPVWRRGFLAIALGLTSLVAILWPLLSIFLRPPPEGHDKWMGQVAMQSSWATCSPAAAATLLNAAGIRTSERELIPLCLTDYDGTPTLGLYRGVKLIANRNGRQVEIIDRSLESLLQDDDWPVLISVRLPFGVDDPRFADEWGWIPGMGHAVVALGRTPDGGFAIGDPAIGLEHWPESKMETLWQGIGLRVR
jgi:hypothetical protein